MKKLNVLTRMLLLVALLVGNVGSVWGETATWTATNGGLGSSIGSGTFTDSQSNSWNYTRTLKSGSSFSGWTENCIQLGKKGGVENITLSTDAYSAYTISEVSVKCSSYNGAHKVSIKVGDTTYLTATNTSSWTTVSEKIGKGSSSGEIVISFTDGSRALYIKSITVTYSTGGGTPTVSTPTFSVGTGTYTTAQNVTLACATDGATIHYTTTGVDPTESDATYSSPISVTTTGTTIKAKAFKDGMDASAVASATYTIKPNKPTITITGNAISITGDDGCTFYYTTNGDAPDNTKTKYTTPFDLNEDCTIKAKAYDSYDNASDAKSLSFKYMPLAPKNINSNYYVKVTDASTLENGDAVLIVCETDGQALGTTQNDNNRADANVTISEGVIQNPSASVQKLTLVKKTETISEKDKDVFYFYTGSGYLYAASNSSNHLKTETTPDDNNNARAIISISSGDASVIFSGNNSHNDLRHNKKSDLFSCYESSSELHVVQIYKEVVRPVTVTSAEYGTLYYENVALKVPTGAEAYTVKVADKKLVRSKTYNAGDVIAAGTAVVVKAIANSYAFTASDVEGVGDDNNLLKGSDVAAITTGPAGCKFYKLSLDASNTAGTVGFYWGAADGAAFTSGAHKAYLVIPSDVTLSGKESFLFSDIESDSEGLSEETTGIRSIEQTTENGVRYNLAGQKVGADYKGIVIVNGKKMLNK